ncbi:DUF2459 domain-containing protein [Taklimakanibacter albus]|uniref:DUF2459 domain-containing protein n=1 Tax=Taklimakanibacter albus TaxID=2800327 RepID=A0ACC5R1M8_9HYPH|nr:DUF2459 domain-containing protein [Aestuariivirga sp. YIM B02566]MBK1866545.1 DUF2459 domain-containing protein [Aestuariivirga sp. YIM B02566]
MRGALRFGTRLLAALLLLIVLYLIAALGFALLPVSGRPQQAGDEPVVYVCTSLAHADIVLPSRDPLIDWSALFPAVARPDLPAEAYLAFGWGDLRFFRETPDWADVRPAIAFSALAGLNDTALREIAVNPPADDPECVTLNVDRAGRQALIDHIRATVRDTTPAAQDRLEAYYIAKGRYSPLRTCNQWVADGLAAAGQPYARFAPFSFSITWPLGTLRSPPGKS